MNFNYLKDKARGYNTTEIQQNSWKRRVKSLSWSILRVLTLDKMLEKRSWVDKPRQSLY